MDATTIRQLRDLNNEFYLGYHESFSETRSHAWKGWNRVLSSAPDSLDSVLDVACGNMRFKSFLDETLDSAYAYYGVDSCVALAPEALRGSFQELDLIDELEQGTLATSLKASSCGLTACFGFMHHVPSQALRASLMHALLDKTIEGGIVAVSFWQFALDDMQRAKAQEATSMALQTIEVTLEEGDYLLGWQNKPGAYRYCHSFTDGEVAQLVEACGGRANLVDQFNADGKTGRMNAYVVLRKR